MTGKRRFALVAVVGLALAFGASASATIDASFTARTAATAGDCNGNGVGDFSEAAWSNRDDDADGFCNSVDVCPREASAVNDGSACQMQAVTVPARPDDPSVPHVTYSGAQTTLKGVARYGANQFMWDFGDGTAATPWVAIANPYNLAVNHTYTGVVGRIFAATLSIRNSAAPNVVSSASYLVQIEDGGSNVSTLTADQFDVRRQMAIDNGLWYLHLNMSRGTYADSAPGWAQPYGYWSGSAHIDCLALDAFEQNGSSPAGRVSTDPYVEDVQRGLAYMLANLHEQAIVGQQYGNPDANGNGRGISAGSGSTIPAMASGRCLMALADGDAGSSFAQAGTGNVHGLTLAAVGQDMVDWLAWAQEDGTGFYRGGWGYNPNSGQSTNEVNRWAILGLRAAESSLGATIAPFVRQQAPYWLLVSRYTGNADQNGGAGDFSSTDLLTVSFTGGAIIGDQFGGNAPQYPSTEASEGFIYRHWNDNDGTWRTNLGDSDAMYTVMRAMTGGTSATPLLQNYDYANHVQLAGGFDWFRSRPGQSQQGIGTNLLSRQAFNGSWTDSTGIGGGYTQGTVPNTALDVAILESAGVPVAAPTAVVSPVSPVGINQAVQLDASGSASHDGSALTFAWDLDGDGVFDDATGSTAAFSSPTYGTFPVCVQVTDGSGRTGSACVSVSVVPGAHPPHASQPASYDGVVNVPLQLDASSSYDVDGDPITFTWDLNNDGQFTDATGATPTVTFSQTGDFAVAVKATAVDGSSIAYAVVHVGAHAPVASAGGPYTGTAGQSITLDASGSSDPDGLALTYGWDLDNNGTFTDSTSAQPTFTIGNVAAGTVYSVCVKVTNSAGRSSVACTTVTVAAAVQPPVAQIVSPNVVVSGPLPRTVSLDASHSSDPQGRPLTFSWTASGGTLQNATSALASLTVAHYGSYSATVRVDNGLLSSSATAQVQAQDTTPPSFTSPPQDLTLQAGPTTAASVNAWLASVTATDDDPDHPGAAVANDFIPNAGIGGVGIGNSVKVTWTATDSAGNTAQASATVTVIGDTTPPVVTPVVTGTAGDNGWYTSDVHVSWQVSDPESAVSAQTGCADADVTADTNTAGRTFTCAATSGGGTTTASVTVKRDATPPTITAARAPAPNAAGWNADDVTVTYTCGDALSGLAQCSAPAVLHEGAAQSATGTAHDAAGNSASATVSGVNVDKTGPSLAGAPTGSANINGWYRADVPVHWTCSDPLSGVDGCPADTAVTGEGTGLTSTASVADRAGNVTAAVSSPAVKIDRTPPATDASAPSGWSSAGVTVTLAATDNLSGVAATYYSLDGAPTAVGSSVAIDSEGVHTLTYWSVDGADNVEATRSVTVRIDRSAPTITHSLSPAPNTAGWNNTDVSVAFSCGDALSGIASCTALQVLTGEGASQHVAGHAADNAGNTADDDVTVSIDKTAPSVAAAADRAPNADGWYSSDVIVSFLCGDALSGVASCPAAVTLREGAAQSAAGTAKDAAGNAGSGSLGGLNVDETAPVVTFTGNAGTYTIAQTVSIACTATDALSGIASTTCAPVSGPAASFGLGTTSRSASATDRAGNVGTGSVTFTVGVTCGALHDLIGQWVSNAGVASSLQAKVDAICAAPNANAKSGKLGAFDNQVAAQTGKALTKEHADLLVQYAGQL